MQATLSPKCQIVIPLPLREKLGLRPGDTIEIEDRAIKKAKRRHAGLVKHLMSCPVQFDVPETGGYAQAEN